MRIEAGKAFIFKNRLHMQRMHLISFSIINKKGYILIMEYSEEE